MMFAGNVRSVVCALSLGLLAACGANETILEGERIAIRPDADQDVDPSDLPKLTVSSAVTRQDWTHENANPRHLAGHHALSYPLTASWSASLGRGASRIGRITSGPVVADGRIFAMDAGAQLTALDASGAVLWRSDLTLKGEGRDDGFGGGLAFGDDVLVATTGFGEVVALKPEDGAVLWRQKLEAPVRAAPTVAGGFAFVVARNDQAFAIDLKNGRIRWRVAGIDPDAGVLGGASPAIHDGLVVLPFASGEVIGALARNGRRAWTTVITGGRRGHVRARLSDVTGDPVIAGETVYVANQSGRLVAMDRRSGDRLWTVNEGSLGPVLPMGGSIFVLTDGAELKRLDRQSGKELWSRQLPAFAEPEKRRGAITHTSPLLAGGRLLVASGDGVLRSFDPATGEIVEETQTGAALAAVQPAISNGVLYVVAQDGTLFAFQ